MNSDIFIESSREEIYGNKSKKTSLCRLAYTEDDEKRTGSLLSKFHLRDD